MKTYYNAARSRAIWYDPYLRLWTLQCLDPDGNQVGEADYCQPRGQAFDWLQAAS